MRFVQRNREGVYDFSLLPSPPLPPPLSLSPLSFYYRSEVNRWESYLPDPVLRYHIGLRVGEVVNRWTALKGNSSNAFP